MVRLQRADWFGVIAYLAVWGASVAYLYARGGDWMSGVQMLAIFGVAMLALAWIVTRGAKPPEAPVAKPALELGAIVIYLALYAVLFTGYGMSWAREVLPRGPEQEMLVLALKIGVHVVGPALLLFLLGARIAPLFRIGANTRAFWLTLIVMGAALTAVQTQISSSLQNIADADISTSVLVWAAPASFIWLVLEAGLCEEFLFRAVTQTRVAAFFNSAIAGVAIASLLFGLAHAPGLFIRGNAEVEGWSSDPFQVAAYTVATLSPLALVFGLIYARTKSLLLVVLLHTIVDFLPGLPRFVGIWS